MELSLKDKYDYLTREELEGACDACKWYRDCPYPDYGFPMCRGHGLSDFIDTKKLNELYDKLIKHENETAEMLRHCPICGGDTVVKEEPLDFVMGDYRYRIKDVHCRYCSKCGEQVYSEEEALKIINVYRGCFNIGRGFGKQKLK